MEDYISKVGLNYLIISLNDCTEATWDNPDYVDNVMYDELKLYLESDTTSVFDERSLIRVSTAPARPLTDLEEFKRSTEFMLLEQTIICSS